ncbi:histidine phosphatase family protein [Caulobacter segnis]
MIYLCRHGQTFHNREGRMQGQTESDLTPLGRLQAAAMADLLYDLIQRDPPAEWRIVASPLRRARDTAETIGARLGLPVAFEDRLLEISVGDWSNRLRDEVKAENPALLTDPEWAFKSPNGETYEAIMDRVSGWLADQAPEPERKLIVVSHGIAGWMLRGAYAGMPREQVIRLDTPQDAIFRLSGGQVDRLNCAPVAEPA